LTTAIRSCVFHTQSMVVICDMTVNKKWLANHAVVDTLA